MFSAITCSKICAYRYWHQQISSKIQYCASCQSFNWRNSQMCSINIDNALYNLNTCYIFCVGLPVSFKYMHNNGCTGILLSMLSCTLLHFFHSYFTLSVFSRKKYLLKSRPSFPKLWLGVIATLSHPCLCCCNSPQISMRFH